MKIEKAIEILELELHSAVTLSTHNSKDAIKLGIKALRHIKDKRATINGKPIYRLPGETK